MSVGSRLRARPRTGSSATAQSNASAGGEAPARSAASPRAEPRGERFASARTAGRAASAGVDHLGEELVAVVAEEDLRAAGQHRMGHAERAAASGSAGTSSARRHRLAPREPASAAYQPPPGSAPDVAVGRLADASSPSSSARAHRLRPASATAASTTGRWSERESSRVPARDELAERLANERVEVDRQGAVGVMRSHAGT